MDKHTFKQPFNTLTTQGLTPYNCPDIDISRETEENVLLQTDGNDVTLKTGDNVCVFEDKYTGDKDCIRDKEMRMLMAAFEQACASKQPTPLLKYELRCLIQARRLTQGMDELAVQFMNPTVSKLSAAELEQAARRRRQNRLAARRCRQKRRLSEDMMLETIQHLKQQNQQLQHDANLLRQEKQLLMETVVEHLLHCPCLSQISLETAHASGEP
ncbi:hypothetical protein BsWGS_15259 [Bradybaena similaris]